MIFGMFCIFAGVLFLGKVWGKIRPMIEIEKDDVTYHAGISHSFKKGMIPFSINDLENSDLELSDDSFSGLSNKSKLKLKFGIMGNTKSEYEIYFKRLPCQQFLQKDNLDFISFPMRGEDQDIFI